MNDLWAYYYSGEAFIQGGIAHFAAIAVLFALVLAGWRIKPSDDQRRIIRWVLAGILLVNEIGWHVWHISYGLWSFQELLPLEICNLMVITSILTLIYRSQVGYEFVYLLGIPAASQVLITPALGPYGFPHLLFFQIFISHGGVVLAGLYLTLGERMRPQRWVSIVRVAGITMLYALGIFFLNPYLGSNYLFLAQKPPAETLLNYLGPWPWYGLAMAVIGLCLAVLLYLPFALSDRARRRDSGTVS